MIQKKIIFSLRILTEVVFLSLFAVLVYLGKIQLWLAVFGGSALLASVFSRFYCGWICPMNTLFRPVSYLYGKLGIKRLAAPSFLKKPFVRYLFLTAFLLLMIVTKRLGMELPLLAIIVALSVLIILFFEEDLWHNHLCPYGTILHLTSRTALRGVHIDEGACISCGKCQKICPARAIDTLETKKRKIRKTDCLTCHECEEVCPTGAIKYELQR